MTTILPSRDVIARPRFSGRGVARGVSTTRPAAGVEIDGKFLRVKGERFWVKAVTYGTFKPNSAGEPFPEIEQVRADFAAMREARINTVRLYTPPSGRIAGS